MTGPFEGYDEGELVYVTTRNAGHRAIVHQGNFYTCRVFQGGKNQVEVILDLIDEGITSIKHLDSDVSEYELAVSSALKEGRSTLSVDLPIKIRV